MFKLKLCNRLYDLAGELNDSSQAGSALEILIINLQLEFLDFGLGTNF